MLKYLAVPALFLALLSAASAAPTPAGCPVGDSPPCVAIQNGTGGGGAVTQSGTWTVQPGNTANTTPWLVTPTPNGVTSTQTAFTVTTGATFQTLAASSATRKGCLVQNTSTHTMYVFFGATGSATTGNSFQVSPGNSISCVAGGNVLTDNIAATTSTTADTGVLNLN